MAASAAYWPYEADTSSMTPLLVRQTGAQTSQEVLGARPSTTRDVHGVYWAKVTWLTAGSDEQFCDYCRRVRTVIAS